MLFWQEKSCHGSGCLHVGASAALGSGVLHEGVRKGVGADGKGFAKPQKPRACTQGRLRTSVNPAPVRDTEHCRVLMPKCGHGCMSSAKITHVLGACGIAEIQRSNGGSGVRGTRSFPLQIIPSVSGLSWNSSGQRQLAVVKARLHTWPEIVSLQPHVWQGLGSGD